MKSKTLNEVADLIEYEADTRQYEGKINSSVAEGMLVAAEMVRTADTSLSLSIIREMVNREKEYLNGQVSN